MLAPIYNALETIIPGYLAREQVEPHEVCFVLGYAVWVSGCGRLSQIVLYACDAVDYNVRQFVWKYGAQISIALGILCVCVCVCRTGVGCCGGKARWLESSLVLVR